MRLTLLLHILVLPWMLCASAIAQPNERHIGFEVEVLDSGGRGVPGLRVSMHTDRDAHFEGITDERGIAISRINAARLTHQVSIRVFPTAGHAEGWHALAKHSAFEEEYAALVSDQADVIRFTIRARPALSMSGTLHDKGEPAQQATIMVTGALALPRIVEAEPETGAFVAGPVPRGERPRLFARLGDPLEASCIDIELPLDVDATLGDGNLGVVDLRTPDRDAQVRIDLADFDDHDGPVLALWEAQGRWVVGARTHEFNHKKQAPDLRTISLPAGSYYAFGYFTPDERRIALLDALRAGEAGTFEMSGVPWFTVQPGQMLDITLDKDARTWDRDALHDALDIPMHPEPTLLRASSMIAN